MSLKGEITLRIKKMAFVLLSVLTAITVAGCSGEDKANENDNKTTENEKGTETTAPERDANETVAVVNGEEIKQQELSVRLQQVKDSYKQQGIDLGDENNTAMLQQMEKQALNQLVDSHLLIQAAEADEINLEKGEVDKVLEGIEEQFGDEKKFEEALKKYNMTKDDLKEQVTSELIINKYLEKNTEEIKVTDDEAKKIYDTYAKNQEDIPPFEEIKDSIKNQLNQQKQLEQTQKVVDKLREDGKVEIKI